MADDVDPPEWVEWALGKLSFLFVIGGVVSFAVGVGALLNGPSQGVLQTGGGNRCCDGGRGPNQALPFIGSKPLPNQRSVPAAQRHRFGNWPNGWAIGTRQRAQPDETARSAAEGVAATVR